MLCFFQKIKELNIRFEGKNNIKTIVIFNIIVGILISLLICLNPIDSIYKYSIGRQTFANPSKYLIYDNVDAVQTFVNKNESDTIEILIGAANNSYRGTFIIELNDEYGNILEVWNIDKLDLYDPWVRVKLKNKTLEEGKKYSIKISAPSVSKANAIAVFYGLANSEVGGELKFSAIDIDEMSNCLSFSVSKEKKNVFFYTSIVILCFCSNLYLLRRNKGIEKNGLIFLVGSGLIMLFIMSPLSGPDEDYHYYSSYVLSNIMMGNEKVGEIPKDDYLKFEVHRNSNYNFKKVLEGWNNKNTEEQVLEYDQSRVDRLYAPASHIIPALGISVARLLNMNNIELFYMARVFNLFAYIFMCYIAIRITPIKKSSLLFVACMPMAMHQASQLSYDVIVNGLSIVFVSYIVSKARKDVKYSWEDTMLCLGMLMIFAPVKIIYFLLSLCLFIIPTENFKSKKDKALKLSAIIGGGMCFSILVKIFDILPNILSKNTRLIADKYGIGFLENNPARFFKIIIYNICNNTWEMIKEAIGSKLAGLSIDISEIWVISYIILILLSALFICDDSLELKFKQRKLLLFVFLSGILTVFVVSMSFTFYGNIEIQGWQGRYLIPFFSLLIFALGNYKVDYSIKEWKVGCLFWIIEAAYIIQVMQQISI